MLKQLSFFWNNSSTVKNITVVGLGDFLSQIINVCTAILLIRVLTIEDQASFSAMNSIANLSSGLIGSGINLALVRFSTEYASRNGKNLISLYYFVFIVEIVIFLVVTIFALAFPDQVTKLILGEVDFTRSLQFGLLYGMGNLLTQLGRSIYQSEEKFKKFIFVLLLRQSITLVVILLLWGLKSLSFNSFALAISSIYILIGFYVFIKSSRINSYQQFFGSILEGHVFIRPFLTASGWLVGYFLLITFIGQIDILTITRFSTKIDLAIYGVAVKYYSMALIFLGSINSVLLPKFSRIDMHDPKKQRSFSIKWIKISSLLIIPILIFDFFGEPLFVWVNGVQYSYAFNILVIFSAGILLSFILSPQTNIIIARGNYQFLFKVSLLALIFCVVGNFLIVPAWGVIGASIVMVLTHNFIIQLPILMKIFISKN